jgi:hypothetical protein
MKSSTTVRFRRLYAALPADIRSAARKQFRLWRENRSHPSVQFKKVGRFWSARVTDSFRALAYLKGDDFYWFWIGRHDEYDQILKGK